MKRAWTLLPLAWIPVVIAIGCNQDGLTRFWPPSNWGQKPKPVSEQPVISEPMPVDVATTAPAMAAAGERDRSQDPKALSVGQQIESYLNRLPPDQQNGQSSPGAAGQANPAPSGQSGAEAVIGPPASTAHPQPAGDGHRYAPASRPAGVALFNPPAVVASGNTAATGRPTGREPVDVASPSPSAVMASPSVPLLGVPTPTPPAGTHTPQQPRVDLVDVRPASTAGPSASPDPAAPSANQPAVAPNPPPVPSDMTGLIAQLEESVKNHPQQLDDQLKLRLLYLATGQDAKAVAPVQTSDPAQAEFLNALFKTLRSSKNMIADPAAKDPAVLEAVDELRRLLGQQLPVTIPKIALVTRVSSFGDYQAVTPLRFPAGRPIHVFLYTEVYNFKTEPSEDGKLHTLLSEKVEIFDSTGKIVWQRTEPKIEDRVSSPRRDFFIPFPVNLPGELPAGDYILKVTVEDKIGSTADQQRLTFAVGK
jgi:hypothetical protein